MEVYQGLLRSPDPRAAQARFETFLRDVPVLPLTVDIARRRAEPREVLRQQGQRVRARALDLLIAATVLEHGLALVTRNVHDDADIADLTLFQPPDVP